MILSAPLRVLGLRGNTGASLAFYKGSESKLSLSRLHIQRFYPLSLLSGPLFLASVFREELSVLSLGPPGTYEGFG